MKNQNDNTQLAFLFDEDGDALITNEDILGYRAEDYEEAPVPLWLWNDPVIFDEKTKEEFLKISAAEFGNQEQFIAEQLNKFYAENSQYGKFVNSDIYENPILLLDFFESLTLEDFQNAKLYAAEKRFDQLQQLIELAKKRMARNRKRPLTGLALIWPILSIRDLVTESELAELFYLKTPRISSRELARQMGAIGKVGGRQALLSGKYKGAFDIVPNRYAYLSYVGRDYWENIETDAAGNLYEKDEAKLLREIREQGTLKKKRRKKENDAAQALQINIKKDLAGTVMAAILKSSTRDGIYLTIYVPDFAREMNKNYRDDYDDGTIVVDSTKPSLMQDLRSFDDWVGILNGNEVRRLIVIVGINKEAKTVTIAAPYFDALIQESKAEELRAVRESKQLYEKPYFNRLIHTTMATERNRSAVGIVVRLTNGLLQRGSKKASAFKENKDADTTTRGDHIEYSISFATLIKEVPELDRSYNNTKSTADKNKMLKRAFEKAYQLMRKKTDAYKYFVDLNVPEKIPTTTTLDARLIITHLGKNPDYKKP